MDVPATAPVEDHDPESSLYITPEAAADYRRGDAKIFDMAVNYANANKWFAAYALEDVLGKRYKNLNLHLTSFSIPALQQSVNTVSYKGYEKEIPGKVLNPSTKEVMLEYIVDSNWENYRSLYAFMSNINGTINPVSTDEATGILPSQYVPLRVYLIGPYKKKIIQFHFLNTWIKVFNEVSLNVNDPQEVKHSITLSFDQFYIEDV